MYFFFLHFWQRCHSKRSKPLKIFSRFSFEEMHYKGIVFVLYLYTNIQMKSVVQDLFFLKKKKNDDIFPSNFHSLWDEKPGSHLEENVIQTSWPNNIYMSSLLAAQF